VLREAVRLVEHHQVARMRRGPNGGLLISEPDAGPATRAVVIYLEYLGTTLGDLLNARLVLEPLAASLAAERIDEAGIERLRGVLRAEEEWASGSAGAAGRIPYRVGGAIEKPCPTTVYRRVDEAYHAVRSAGRGPTRQMRPSRRSTTCTATTPKSFAAVTAGDSARAKDTVRAARGSGDRLAARASPRGRRGPQRRPGRPRRPAT